jgi:hypothetical protein
MCFYEENGRYFTRLIRLIEASIVSDVQEIELQQVAPRYCAHFQWQFMYISFIIAI